MTVDIEKAAALSKLEIIDNREAVERQMNDIFKMAEILTQLDEAEYDETEHIALLREDIIDDNGSSSRDVLMNAACTKDGSFCVPKAVE